VPAARCQQSLELTINNRVFTKKKLIQLMTRQAQRQLAKWISALIMAVIAAVFGSEHLPKGKQADPFPDRVSGAARVIDGDSLHLSGHEIRLKGIDAPEGRQTCQREGRDWPCGNAARDELRQLIGKLLVSCAVSDRDRHGRLLAVCTAGGRDLSGAMVANGMAVAFGAYRREEAEAERLKKGLWSGTFDMPRDWRAERGIGQ
jgi:endonuclease YncB( thermonuclease family)